MPLGDYDLNVPRENVTTYPSKGELLFHPGGISETEILFVYGHAIFASTAGPLAGNHFLTITEGLDQLLALGEKVLWEGAQPIRFAPRDRGRSTVRSAMPRKTTDAPRSWPTPNHEDVRRWLRPKNQVLRAPRPLRQ